MPQSRINEECAPQRLLVKELEAQLLQLYGSPLLSGDALKSALGYNSLDALRQAIAREKIPVPIFQMDNRRGKYALVIDVARYLAQLRSSDPIHSEANTP